VAELPGKYECSGAGVSRFRNNADSAWQDMLKYDDGGLSKTSYAGGGFNFYFSL